MEADAGAAQTLPTPPTLRTELSQTWAVWTAVETSHLSWGSGPARVAPTGPPRALLYDAPDTLHNLQLHTGWDLMAFEGLHPARPGVCPRVFLWVTPAGSHAHLPAPPFFCLRPRELSSFSLFFSSRKCLKARSSVKFSEEERKPYRF